MDLLKGIQSSEGVHSILKFLECVESVNGPKDIKILRWSEKEDIEAYFTKFKRVNE